VGAIIGAIAGKGKGAVIGAVAGAAAGAGTQILVKGKEVQVPAETVLRFQLDQAVSLQAVK
jgi:outer membrane lipoprotein SlyB